MALFATGFFTSAQAQTTTVRDVHEAMLTYRCQCSQAAYNAMSEDAQWFLRMVTAMSDEQIADEIEAKKGMEKWDGMVLDIVGFDLATLESCTDEAMRAVLKKKFPKNKDAAVIEDAINSPPDEATMFFWNMREDENMNCDFIRGFVKLNGYRAAYPEAFEIDLGLDDK